MKHVLFLCTGNSARSQIAEGLVNHHLGDQWQARSAGTAPAGFVHPRAIQAMAELGIDISHQRSKAVAEFQGVDLDLVITVCDGAAENCPLWLGPGRKMHLGFPDPAAVVGSPEEQMAVFRQVRDEMRARLLELLTRQRLPRV